MPEFTKSPGHDWEITYETEDGVRDAMIVFGQMKIEDAILEARRSLSFNFFKLPDFVASIVIEVRRI